MRYLAFVLAVAFLAGCGGDVTYESPYKGSSAGSTPVIKPLTDADAMRLLVSRCSGCHSDDYVRKAELPTAAWEAAVNHCIQEGAMIRPVEKDSLVDYLKKKYGK